MKKFCDSGQLLPKGEAVPVAEEVKALRKERARLQMENGILKRAAACFAKESL